MYVQKRYDIFMLFFFVLLETSEPTSDPTETSGEVPLDEFFLLYV